jgi:hypothetical protein
VSFYDGATKLADDTTPPYEFVWMAAQAGTHLLTAVAVDDSGLATASNVVNVTVTGLPPSVTMTSPVWVSGTPTPANTSPATVNFEATAVGVPVAASRIGGIPDLIDDGRTGYLFDPLDAGSIRQAISRWAENPEETAALAKTAKQEALARFHPRVVAARHLEIYREVLEATR